MTTLRAARFALALGVAFAAHASDALAEPAAAGRVDYVRDVRPILARHCFHCHGPKEEEGGLRLDERKRVLAGGTIGPALVPGKSAESLIYQYITGRNEDKVIMPPKGKGQRLSDAECEVIRRWIDTGAEWPDARSSVEPPADTATPPQICRETSKLQATRRAVRARRLSARGRFLYGVTPPD